MTDNDIIKALECCKDTICKDCPRLHDKKGILWCKEDLQKDALDLINRQKAEIERLQSMNQEKLDNIHDIRTENERLNKLCKEQNEEIKRQNTLKINNVCLMKDIALIKAEAVKEFSERLKSYLHQDDFETPDERWKPESEFASLIDNLLKETEGEK